jgi:hypothetical protein
VDSIWTFRLGLHADFPLELLFRTVYALLYVMLRQVNGEKVETRLLYFMLIVTRISSATS